MFGTKCVDIYKKKKPKRNKNSINEMKENIKYKVPLYRCNVNIWMKWRSKKKKNWVKNGKFFYSAKCKYIFKSVNTEKFTVLFCLIMKIDHFSLEKVYKEKKKTNKHSNNFKLLQLDHMHESAI